MDNHAIDLPCSMHGLFAFLVLFLVPILLSRIFRHEKNHRKDGPNLPPGPWQLPVIGSLHHLLIKNPRLIHRTLTDLARRFRAPIMYLRLGELPIMVISSAGAAEEVMRTHDITFAERAMTLTVRATFADRAALTVLPYGDQWRQLRKICTVELLSAKRVRSFRPVREVEAARLVATIISSCASGGQVNVSKAIADYVADSALRAVMGKRFKWRHEFLEALDKVAKKISMFSVGDLFPSSRLACTVDGTVRESRLLSKKLCEMVDSAIDEYHEQIVAAEDDAHPGDDECMMGALLRMQKEGSPNSAIPMDTIRIIIPEMISAGSHPTSTTLQWAISELMRNPKVMQKAQAEVRLVLRGRSRVTEKDLIDLKYLKHVIKETLRLHPAAPLLMPKECRESCNILGYDVPKGTMMMVNVWAISRDTKYWDDAEVFKPERFEGSTMDFKGANFEFIPFGAGRRICPGILFAQAGMELALAVLLYHFDWQLPPGVTPDRMDMTEELGVTIGRKTDLHLCPILRVRPEPTD